MACGKYFSQFSLIISHALIELFKFAIYKYKKNL